MTDRFQRKRQVMLLFLKKSPKPACKVGYVWLGGPRPDPRGPPLLVVTLHQPAPGPAPSEVWPMALAQRRQPCGHLKLGPCHFLRLGRAGGAQGSLVMSSGFSPRPSSPPALCIQPGDTTALFLCQAPPWRWGAGNVQGGLVNRQGPCSWAPSLRTSPPPPNIHTDGPVLTGVGGVPAPSVCHTHARLTGSCPPGRG